MTVAIAAALAVIPGTIAGLGISIATGKAAEAIAALKALGHKEFVKTTETLDRAALSRQPAEFLEQIGAYIRQSDEFYYDVSGEEAEL